MHYARILAAALLAVAFPAAATDFGTVELVTGRADKRAALKAKLERVKERREQRKDRRR